jgi:hypothetical protein
MRHAPFNKIGDLEAYLSTVLGTIRKANGYNTDIGLRVMRGRRKIDDSQVPCAVIIEGEDRPGNTNGRKMVRISQDFVLGGYDVCDPDNPNDTAHLIVADIKKAIWLDDVHDLNLGGRVEEMKYEGKDIGPRIDGEPIVFAVVHCTAAFTEKLTDA